MQPTILLLTLITLALIALKYHYTRESKKLLVSLGLFGVLIALAIAGNITRPITPLFLGHIILVIAGWLALLWYILKTKLHLWVILSPIVTIMLFLLFEKIVGSAN